jgi:hypothetical protein
VRRKQRKESYNNFRKNNKSQYRKSVRESRNRFYLRNVKSEKVGNTARFKNYRDYQEYRDWWNKNTWKSLTLNGVHVWIRGDKHKVWHYASKKKTREYMKRWREDNEEYMREYLREYHKRNRERYHRDTDMGYKLARDKFGNPDFETERSVIDAEFARLGLKKKKKVKENGK